MAKKMTFGFRNVNGVTMSIKMLSTPNGRWPSQATSNRLADYVVGRMNYYGKRAEKLTKSKRWTPVLTGAMMKSIRWVDAKRARGTGAFVTGVLGVFVPYGRYQEFNNRRKPFFLQRALDFVYPNFIRSLRRKRILEGIVFSKYQGDFPEKNVAGGRFGGGYGSFEEGD